MPLKKKKWDCSINGERHSLKKVYEIFFIRANFAFKKNVNFLL